MNAPFDPASLTPDSPTNEKFAVGQPVSRKEDPVLLRGEGRYTDDLNRPGQLYGVMVRSRIAHGVVRSLDTDAARNRRSRSPPNHSRSKRWRRSQRTAVAIRQPRSRPTELIGAARLMPGSVFCCDQPA